MISVILPVYKVERYIDKCIQNLQAQTLKNLEIIFVDDCGNDNSIDLINKYAQTDERIKLVHNEHNMGAGATRNHGIEAATGEYISFVDPDDWMNVNFYENLYNKAQEGDYDVVKGRRIDVIQKADGELFISDNDSNRWVESDVKDGYPLYACFYHGHQSAIFRLSLVKQYNAHYSNTSFGECGMFILMACCHTSKYAFADGANYYYLQHEDSSAHMLSWQKYESELKAIFEQMEYVIREFADTKGVNKYVEYKFHFLMWRYGELEKYTELHKYRFRFLKLIWEELGRINHKELRNEVVKITNLYKKLRWLASIPYRALRKIYRITKRYCGRLKSMFIKNKVKKFCIEDVSFEGREIAYMQNERGAVFFTKKFLETDKDFAFHFVSDFYDAEGLYCNDLPVDSDLYKEHIALAKQNELCWKYIRRLEHISKSTIYLDDKNQLWMKGKILDSNEKIDTKNHILLPQPTRQIIEGQTLQDYLLNLGTDVDAVSSELIKFLDYVFNKYATCDPYFIQGIAFDACPRNCILKEGHEYELYDFEYEYKTSLERGFFINLASAQVNESIIMEVYKKLCAHYLIIENYAYWGTMIYNGWLEIIDNTTDCKYFLKNLTSEE